MDTHIIAKTFVFNPEHQVLLLVRSDDDVYRPGCFDLPGGAVEPGEEYKAGAIREALEEGGLVLQPGDTHLVYALADTGVDKEQAGQPAVNRVRLFFMAGVADSTVALSHEHQDYEWLPLDEAIARTDHPRHKEVLQYIRDNNLHPELWK
jgi:8-oxo-dGTP pyrophosphatase MutT (NUDIX family)